MWLQKSWESTLNDLGAFPKASFNIDKHEWRSELQRHIFLTENLKNWSISEGVNQSFLGKIPQMFSFLKCDCIYKWLISERYLSFFFFYWVFISCCCSECGVCLGVWCLFDGRKIPEALSQRRPLTLLPLLKDATYTPFTHPTTHTHMLKVCMFIVCYVMLCYNLLSNFEKQDHTCMLMCPDIQVRKENDREQGLTWQPSPGQVQLITTSSQQPA